jgi:hypothetical protein
LVPASVIYVQVYKRDGRLMSELLFAAGFIVALGFFLARYLLTDRRNESTEERLVREAERHLRKHRNHQATAFWANHHRRAARRKVKMAERIVRNKKKEQGTKTTVTVKDSGHAAANCPECGAAVLLNIGEARERNEAALETRCDHCDSTIAVSWKEAAGS